MKKYFEHKIKVKYLDALFTKSEEWDWFVKYIVENFDLSFDITSYGDYKASIHEIKSVFDYLIRINEYCNLIVDDPSLSQLNNIAKFYLNKLDYKDLNLVNDFYKLLTIQVIAVKIKNQLNNNELRYLIYPDIFSVVNKYTSFLKFII